MNRLVKALIERPQVIDQKVTEETARQKQLSFEQLLDALSDGLFSEPELHHIQGDDQLRQRLELSYLPTISAPEWNRALSLTENRTASSSGWWTVMVAGASGHFGLTAPQDSSTAEVVALYTGQEDSAKVLVYSPARGTIREVTSGPHCGPLRRGICLEGSCHGCKAYEVYDEATRSTGIKCTCDHEARQR